ncbi:hypothetical protein H5996_01180 [Faecalicoccus pleomorphus]|uniref:hypothetical protein n=1 Tax=Faecalicoccus pleomorphus TaxID=1323 RepID=UPI001960AD3E|nr:hypothetical protein [Faecalicoccus pleomorphus]MBM6764517.1 hypothetical protein [Faecalicoccus pleomorphus]
MRYDTPIFFRAVTPGDYDESTGNYEDDSIIETMVMASVMDTQTETMKLVYGDIRQGSLTLTIQNHCDQTFDNIRIGDKVYRVDRTRRLRVKQSFIVSEVQ